MKGKIIYLEEEWMLNCKSSKLKKESQYIEVTNWKLSKQKPNRTRVHLVDGRSIILPGKRKGGQVWKVVGGKDKVKSVSWFFQG